MSYVDYVEKNNTVYNFTSKSVADRFDTTTAYAVGDIVYYEDKLYRFTTAHPAGAWNASHVVEVKVADEITDLKEALTTAETTLTHKADKDGTVASAEQLLSDIGTEDKAPYLFRAVPYDSTRVDEEVVGCSVGWNQLVHDGDFRQTEWWTPIHGNISTSNNVLTYTCTSSGSSLSNRIQQSITTVVDHIYLASADIKTETANTGRFYFLGDSASVESANTWTTISELRKANLTNGSYQIGLRTTTSIGETFQARNAYVIDLTAWFGSTIADYAYTLEQATAGSGVAFIKALLPGGYIPYSAPKMESVSGLSGHRFTGFNWFDEEWESGSLDQNNGGPLVNADWSRSKNYIKVLPGATYYFEIEGLSSSNGAYVFYYGADKNFLGYDSLIVSNNRTLNGNVGFIRIQYKRAIAVVTDYKVCINLSDPAKNGTYEPYKATTYALDSDLTLRGILKMDSDHRVYADGDVYKADGTVTRRYGVVDLGTLTWSSLDSDGHRIFYVASADFPSNAAGYSTNDVHNMDRLLCEKYGRSSKASAGIWEDKTFYYGGSYFGARAFSVCDSAYETSTKAQFKEAMSGVHLLYPISGSISATETADPYASPQNCTVGGTEEYIYAEGGSGVVVGHNSKYLADLKGELERVMVAVPDAPSANGTYTLKATVTAQGVTYGWVSD